MWVHFRDSKLAVSATLSWIQRTKLAYVSWLRGYVCIPGVAVPKYKGQDKSCGGYPN